MSRDLSPQELDPGLPDLADRQAIDREPREREPGERSATSRGQGHAPELFSRDRLAEIRFDDGRALLSREGASWQLSESEIRTLIDLGIDCLGLARCLLLVCNSNSLAHFLTSH